MSLLTHCPGSLVKVRTLTAIFDIAKAVFGSDRVTLYYVARDRKGKQTVRRETVNKSTITHMVYLRG